MEVIDSFQKEELPLIVLYFIITWIVPYFIIYDIYTGIQALMFFSSDSSAHIHPVSHILIPHTEIPIPTKQPKD